MSEEAIPGQVITKQPTSDSAKRAEEAGGAGVEPEEAVVTSERQGRKKAEDEAESEALSELAKADKIVVEQKATYSEACCGYEGEG